MGKHDELRQDKTCQNCGHVVNEIYCPSCGQKNIETRQSFVHLIGHFAEDFTHYDTALWKTIKYLLFYPAKLTREYLSGKRQSYVLPVKLYIFTSFITFLLLALVNGYEHRLEKAAASASSKESKQELKTSADYNGVKVSSYEQLDSLIIHSKNKPSGFTYWIIRKKIELDHKGVTGDDISEAFNHTLPKVLFLYMPLFAFWLWLLHGKKTWYFFDHGIFTLHYFSLLLLLMSIEVSAELSLTFVAGREFGHQASGFLGIVIFLYAFVYFFRAHRKMYNESRLISGIKSLVLFFINMISLSIAMLLALAYVFYNM